MALKKICWSKDIFNWTYKNLHSYVHLLHTCCIFPHFFFCYSIAHSIAQNQPFSKSPTTSFSPQTLVTAASSSSSTSLQLLTPSNTPSFSRAYVNQHHWYCPLSLRVYLANTEQSVNINNCVSSIAPQSQGALQGSVIGPLLLSVPKSLTKTTHTTLSLSALIRSLRVIFDRNFFCEHHVNQITRTAFVHLNNIDCLRPSLSFSTPETLIHAFSASRIDYIQQHSLW